MSKKMDIELALYEGRYGDLIRYLNKRVDMMGKSLNRLTAIEMKNKESENSKRKQE